jgi:16S rRNA C967 or C1407 C5-methylase (RsmB/RsmF family)/NOL1/NOP2/fmu family ribosome biogenesis protein
MSNALPFAFAERMKNRLGDDWNAFENIHQSSSPTSIRLNPKKDSQSVGEKIPWTSSGYYLQQRPVFTLDPTFHAGAYYVQEASSMFLEQALSQSVDLKQPLRILDLCAAPGGKSTHLLSLISEDSLLISNEVIRSRASILSENLQKWGYPNVLVTSNDPGDFEKLNGYFDVIVLDAPCSGEGLFRKDAKAMEEWSQENIDLCSQRQRRIISDVWPSLKENGIIIYCTCTYSEEENENNLNWLENQHAVEFVKLSFNKEWAIEEIKSKNAFGYRFYPHKVNGEGFFLSVMQKKELIQSISTKTKKIFQPAPKKITEQLKDWISDVNFHFIQQEDLLIAIPSSLIDEIEFLARKLHVINKGTALAEVKHDKLIPQHASGLSVCLNKNHFLQIELDESQALSYLRKENLLIGENQKGFALVTFKGNGLGWVNLLGNRLNNLYPSAWRIRMGS